MTPIQQYLPFPLFRSLSFWQDWPPGRQRGGLYLLLAVTILTLVAAWLWLHAASDRAAEQVRTAGERHGQVQELVAEIRGLERQAGRTGSLTGDTVRADGRADVPILIAARQISRDIGLEEKLVTVRPALQATGRDGVQLYYERLNLPELLALLETLERDSRLQTSTVTFNRRLDDPSLADFQLVLYR